MMIEWRTPPNWTTKIFNGPIARTRNIVGYVCACFEQEKNKYDPWNICQLKESKRQVYILHVCVGASVRFVCM